MNRTIYTFYEPMTNTGYEADLHRAECSKVLDIFMQSWRAFGWHPEILSAKDALKHPLYNEVIDKAKSIPTPYDPEYNIRCYQRWLAIAAVGGWYADPDMINYGFPIPEQIPPKLSVSLYPCVCPSVIRMTKDDYDKAIIGTILDYRFEDGHDHCGIRPSGEVCVNDMQILHNAKVRDMFDLRMTVGGEFGKSSYHDIDENDELHAPIVHFTGEYVPVGRPTKSEQILSTKRPTPQLIKNFIRARA